MLVSSFLISTPKSSSSRYVQTYTNGKNDDFNDSSILDVINSRVMYKETRGHALPKPKNLDVEYLILIIVRSRWEA